MGEHTKVLGEWCGEGMDDLHVWSIGAKHPFHYTDLELHLLQEGSNRKPSIFSSESSVGASWVYACSARSQNDKLGFRDCHVKWA